jgi:hypothetical protein
MEGASFVSVGAPAAICESVEGREAVSGMGISKVGCGKVEVPATSVDAAINAFAGGV